MKSRFASIRTLTGAGLAAALLVGFGLAGCDVDRLANESSMTTQADVDLDSLPPEFVSTISQSKPTIVDFTATWCPPCQEQKPLFEEAERQYADVATFVTIDVDEQPEIPAAYEVSSIPTLMVFKDGKPVDQMLGVHSVEEIGEAVTPHAE